MQSIDPAPQNWDKGHFSVIDNWQRLAVDVTHYNRFCYLTCVDCGPSRFAIWRRTVATVGYICVASLQKGPHVAKIKN